MPKRRKPKLSKKLANILGLVDHKYSGKLVDNKFTSYGVILLLLLLLLPTVGLPKGVLGQQTSSGNINVTLRVEGPPPTSIPTIDNVIMLDKPNRLVRVTGQCEYGLLVKVFSNNIFVGSVFCEVSNTYTLDTTIFWDKNVIRAAHYDGLDQGGPLSNPYVITIAKPASGYPGSTSKTPTYYNRIDYPAITIDYSFRNIDPGQIASWKVGLSNGHPPYKMSVIWGDNKKDDYSLNKEGKLDIGHKYKKAGNYVIKFSVKDSYGSVSRLQIGVVVNGTTSTTPIAGTIAPSNCDYSGFWSIFTNISCRFGFIDKLVPLYWMILAILALMWATRLFKKDDHQHRKPKKPARA